MSDVSSLQLAQAGVDAAESKKATDNKLLDLQSLSPFCDYFALHSGMTRIQTRAIANAIEERVKQDFGRLGKRQGYRGGNWILIDYGDVVFHVFLDGERRFYDLERLWKDAPVVYTSPG